MQSNETYLPIVVAVVRPASSPSGWRRPAGHVVQRRSTERPLLVVAVAEGPQPLAAEWLPVEPRLVVVELLLLPVQQPVLQCLCNP